MAGIIDELMSQENWEDLYYFKTRWARIENLQL